MTCDLDREVGIGVAVDVALDDGEVSVSARLERHCRAAPPRWVAPVTSVKLWSPAVPDIGIDRSQIDPSPGSKPTMVSPSAAEADVNLKVSLPAPPFITLTALLAVMVSLPEPVLTFSIPQIVSLPVWELETVPLDNAPDPRLTVTFAVAADMSSVSMPVPPPPVVAEVDVVAIADLGHDQVVCRRRRRPCRRPPRQ